MAKVSWTVAFVAALAFSAVASAQTAPATSSAQPVTVAAQAVTPSSAAEATPIIGLAQIFTAPSTGGISTMPEPKLASCTLFECRQGCHQDGCFSVCTDITTCSCDVICH